jgi:hypothetical protein
MPASLIILLVQAGLQYGPGFVSDIVAILNNPNATVADVEAAFKNLKPYSAYGIPDKIVAPAQVDTAAAPAVGHPVA